VGSDFVDVFAVIVWREDYRLGRNAVTHSCRSNTHPKRELRFFAIRIAEHFEFRADWYRGGAVAALVLEYYVLLRSVLRAKPHLRACLTRCRHCRIFFLTHPRNAGRQDLRCPFGCRQAHRQRASAQRSAAYYGDAKGKSIKSRLNQRRSRKYCAPEPPSDRPRAPAPRRPTAQWNPAMVEHVRMVSSLIEGRRVSRRQVLAMLARVLRQLTIGRRRKIDQTVAWLNEQPP
jgi:hypothetical protein